MSCNNYKLSSVKVEKHCRANTKDLMHTRQGSGRYRAVVTGVQIGPVWSSRSEFDMMKMMIKREANDAVSDGNVPVLNHNVLASRMTNDVVSMWDRFECKQITVACVVILIS